MKNNRIQTKRDAGKKSGFRLLHARTKGRRRQRAVAATPEDLGADVPNVGIGRALIVILVLHVVAIGAVFMHTKWTEEQENSYSSDTPPASSGAAAAPPEEQREANRKPAKHKRAEVARSKPAAPVKAPAALEKKVLNDPSSKPKETSASQPLAKAEVVNTELHSVVSSAAKEASENQQIETVEKSAVLVKPNIKVSTYIVQSGDTVWGICRKHKMSIAEFKALNQLRSDTIRVGQKLRVQSK